MSEDYLTWEDYELEDEPVTPENCSIGSFSPGTEECEFCFWRDACEEWFYKMVTKR